MKFLSLVAAVVCLAVAAIAESSNECNCLPEQFTGKVLLASKLLQDRKDSKDKMGGRDIMDFAVDFINRKIYGRHRRRRGRDSFDLQLFADFGPVARLYIIDKLLDNCISMPISNKMTDRCMFQKDDFRGQMPIAGDDQSSLLGLMYAMKTFGDGDGKLSASEAAWLMILSKSSCMPMMERGGAGSGVTYHDMSTGLGDFDGFILPRSCRVSMKNDMTSLVSSFFDFLSYRYFPNILPRRCCGPARYEAKVTKVTAYTNTKDDSPFSGTQTIIFPYMYVDFIGRKVEGKETVLQNGERVADYSFVGIYEETMILYVVNSTGDGCFVYNMTDITEMPGRCIPSTAEYMDTVNFGERKNDIKVHSWTYPYSGPAINASLQQFVTTDTCMTVFLSYEGSSNNIDFVGAESISDIKTHILNPLRTFRVPEICNGVVPMPLTNDDSIDSMLGIKDMVTASQLTL